MSKNLCSKTRDVNNPYEVYRSYLLPDWEWRVLKKYQSPEGEAKNPFARWYCAVKSPNTFLNSWEYGDTYIRDIIKEAGAYKVEQ